MILAPECALHSLAVRERIIVQAFGIICVVLLRTAAYKVGQSCVQPTPKPDVYSNYAARISLVYPRPNLGRREEFGGDGEGAKNETPQPPTRNQGI